MSRLRRWAVMVPLIISAACGAPRPVVGDPAADCTEDTLEACEKALLAAA